MSINIINVAFINVPFSLSCSKIVSLTKFDELFDSCEHEKTFLDRNYKTFLLTNLDTAILHL